MYTTQKNFSNPYYQVGFCTELISTGATHAIQLCFAPVVYPPKEDDFDIHQGNTNNSGLAIQTKMQSNKMLLPIHPFPL